MIKTVFGLLLISMLYCSFRAGDSEMLAKGEQPQLATDNKGVVRLVYGKDDKIFCSTSKDNGLSFSKPVLVGQIAGMHLGMSRGPQLASSSRYSVITAMDKSGNIHWFRLNNLSGQWISMGLLNDLPGSAPEGLMSIAADRNDNFYAVWLDIRTGKHNQVYFSSLPGGKTHWGKNILAYSSPDGHVCECCQPHITAKGAEIAIMFRNWLNGSRDLYLMTSLNKGKTFSVTQKLGSDTWKLNGCPMDGGSLMIQTPGDVATTWQRKGDIYFCRPGQNEVYLGKGSHPSVFESDGNAVVAFHSKDTIKMLGLKNKKVIIAGEGDYAKAVALPGNQVLSVWEDNNEIKYKRINL